LNGVAMARPEKRRICQTGGSIRDRGKWGGALGGGVVMGDVLGRGELKPSKIARGPVLLFFQGKGSGSLGDEWKRALS